MNFQTGNIEPEVPETIRRAVIKDSDRRIAACRILTAIHARMMNANETAYTAGEFLTYRDKQGIRTDQLVLRDRETKQWYRLTLTPEDRAQCKSCSHHCDAHWMDGDLCHHCANRETDDE